MKVRRSEVESLVKLLILSFKNGINLPFTIPTRTCPDLRPSKKIKKKKCKRRHSEIVVQSYIKDQNRFHLLYYGMHDPEIVYQFDQEEVTLFRMIKKSMKKKKIRGKTLIEVRALKKILKTTKIRRHKRIQVRFSEEEYSIIQAKSQRRNLDFSDYIRTELLS